MDDEDFVTNPVSAKEIEDHGGDLDGATARFGEPAGGWVDLSTGINPRAFPLPDIPSEAWSRLPLASDLAGLKEAAAAAYGAASTDMIACAPGTQAVIQMLPRLIAADRVAVMGPTYSEHAAAWRAAGATVEDIGELPPPDRSLVLVNPNNPDGRMIAPERLAAWAVAAGKGGHTLVVDEAFADVSPEISLVPAFPLPNVIVLRSFGKFHGLAGLRLGFAVAMPDVVRRLEDELGPWAVSGPALTVGAQALADHGWAGRERTRLSADMDRLCDLLRGAGTNIIGRTDLFVLIECERAEALYDHLAKAGILVRRFQGFPKRLRFGLPGKAAHWARLEEALRTFDAVKGKERDRRRHG